MVDSTPTREVVRKAADDTIATTNIATQMLSGITGAIGAAYAFTTGYVLKLSRDRSKAERAQASKTVSTATVTASEKPAAAVATPVEAPVVSAVAAESEHIHIPSAAELEAEFKAPAAKLPGFDNENHAARDTARNALRNESKAAGVIGEELKTAEGLAAKAKIDAVYKEGFLKSPINAFKEMSTGGKVFMGAAMAATALAAILWQQRQNNKVDKELRPDLERAYSQAFADNEKTRTFADKLAAAQTTPVTQR